MVFSLGCFVGLSVAASGILEIDGLARRSTPADLTVAAERLVLPNGLTVLLSPDPEASHVALVTTFRAGTLFEPRGRSGMAHLVEHLMCGGNTPQNDYLGMLSDRGVYGQNAFTSFERMIFVSYLPPEELPFALWVTAERLGTRPAQIDQAELNRHRAIVHEERVLREDVAYSPTNTALFEYLFPDPHPLLGCVIGKPKELDAVTVDDVKSFIARTLVPANGVLAISGRFDPVKARELLAGTVGLVPGGVRVTSAPTAAPVYEPAMLDVRERRSRRSRVTMGWTFDELQVDTVDALQLGAMLLEAQTDGAFGIEVDSDFHRISSGGLFVFNVTLPSGKRRDYALDDAEALLRYLTKAKVNRILLSSAHLHQDRAVMNAIDSTDDRAMLITDLELNQTEVDRSAEYFGRHWSLHPDLIQHLARQALGKRRMVIRSLPVRPLPERGERE
jgi:zinc protease